MNWEGVVEGEEMGGDSVEIRGVMRKFCINSVRLLYRSACKHPFIVGLLCFLLFLYKSFPFLLYLLVSTSPVLVCTAVLLGTLLSFGQPNIPEIEEEEEEEEVVSRHEIDSLKAGVVAHGATVIERDASFGTERFVGLGGDVIEKEEERSEIAPLEAGVVHFHDHDATVIERDVSFGTETFVGLGEDVIEKEEEEQGSEIAQAGVVHDRDATVVERNVSFGTERFVGLGGDVIEETAECESSVETEAGRIDSFFGSFVDNVLVVDGKAREDLYEKGGVDEDERNWDGLELEEERKIHKEKSWELETEGVTVDGEGTEDWYSLVGKGRDEDHDGGEIENQYILVGHGRDEDHDGEEIENHYTLVGQRGDESLDGEEIENRGSLNVEERGGNLEVGTDRFLGGLVGSHTRRPVDSEEEEEEDGESSDDESDGAESSSPDASLTDIIPMLDELHPLLHEGATRPMPHDDSDATSERSSSSHDHIVESDEDSEDYRKEEKVDGDDEEEETLPGEKGHASTSAIAWTEDDQKNVMDLGTSEIERNRRLESLIAKRHARKAISTMKHKDLIDFDSDLHFRVPHITTTRRNPFDGPDDSYADMGLPPIPGSAPSILLSRRNPFDIPYESNEEKPDLKGDGFEEEFSGLQLKESTGFSRHASFSWRPSKLGAPRKQKRDLEGSSYSSLLHRQLSEISDAKTSSVPDSESVSSAIYEDDMKLSELDLSQERKLMPSMDHASDHVSHESQFSYDEDSVHIEEIEQRDANHDEVENSTRDLHIYPTTETGDAVHIEEILQRDADHDEVENSTRDLQIYPTTETEDAVHTEENVQRDDNHNEVDISTRDLQIHPTTETGDAATPMELGIGEIHLKPAAVEDDYSSEFDVNRDETIELEAKGILAEESRTSEHPSLEESEFKNTTEALDVVQQQKEPVYDSIPSPIEKLLSFSSSSSEIAYHPGQEEALAQFTNKESEMQIENRALDIPNMEAIFAASSQAHEVDENVSRPKEVVEVSDHDDVKCVPNEVEKESYKPNDLYQLVPSNLDTEVAVDQNVDENNSEACSHQTPSEDLTLTSQENTLPSEVIEHVSVVHPHLSFSVAEPVEDAATLVELGMGEVHLKPTAVEEDYGSGLSMSLSKVSEVVSDVNREGAIELEAKGILTEKSGISEHPSLDESEFESMTEALDDDGQQQEPVYGSNPSPIENYFLYRPSPIEKLLTFSSISSEEAIAHFTDNRAMDIPSDEVICSASSQTHEEDENVSSSKGVVEVRDYDDGKNGPAEAEKDYDYPNELDQLASSNSDAEVHVAMNQNVEYNNSEASSHQIPSEDLTSTSQERSLPSEVVEHVSVLHPHLSISETEPVEEPAVDEIETHHSGQGQIYSPRLDADVHQDVHEKFDAMAVEQVQMVNPSSLESDHAEEYMLSMEETPDFEEKEVHSSSYDANVSTDVHPDFDVKVVSQSSYEETPSEENNPSESEKQPTWSDKSIVEPSLDEHHELQESYVVQTEVMDAEEGVIDNLTVPMPEFHDSEYKVSPSHDSTLNTPQTSEYESSVAGEAFKKDDEDQFQASGLENNPSVPYETRVPEANINMEDDYIKEIDEGLLSELDRVGDFYYIEEVESLHTEMIQERTDYMNAEFEPLDNELNVVDTNLELPTFEARSVEDIEMAFKQLHEGVDIEEVILPSSFKEEEDMENSVETISNFHVIDARSVDEIHVALKEAVDGKLGKSSEPSELEDGSAVNIVSSTEKSDSDRVKPDVEEISMGTHGESVDGLDEPSDISNFKVINARSNIEVALNDVSDGNMGKLEETLNLKVELAEADKVSSTRDVDSAKIEPEAGETSMAGIVKPVDSLDDASDNSNFHFTSARSMDDIQVVVKEVADGNPGKSAEFEIERVSAEDLDSARVEPDVEETSIAVHDTSIEVLDKASDNSNFKVTEARSVDDIRVVVEEVSDGNLGNFAEPVDFKDGLADDEVAKVSSTEDLYSARVELDGEQTSTAALDKSMDGVYIGSDHSDFQAIDARYLEDSQVPLTEVSDGNLGKLPEKLDPKHGSAEFEVDKVSSTEDPDSARVEPDNEETGMAVHDMPTVGLEASENSNFRVMDARSLEHVHVALEEDLEGNLGKSPEKLDSKDESTEFEVEKVSSVEDLDSAVVEPDVEETSMAVHDTSVDGLDEASDDSNFQVVDARTLEDIHVALEEVSDDNLGKSPEKLEYKDGLAGFEVEKVSATEDLDSTRVESDTEETSVAVVDKSVDGLDESFDNSNFQVIDARGLDDIHVAMEEVSNDNPGKSPEKLNSRQSAEYEDEKLSSSEDLYSAGVEPGVEETSMTVHDKSVDRVDEAFDHSNFQVIDARSIDDIHVALEEVSDGNAGKSPDKLGSKDESTEFEVEKVSSAEDLDFAGLEPGVEETSMAVHDKSESELDEASAKSNFEVIDASSLEGILMALEKVSDGNLGESPEPFDSEDGSAEIEVNKSSRTDDLGSVKVDPDVDETSMAVLDKLVEGLDEASDNSNFQVIDTRSVDDIQVPVKEVSNGNPGNPAEALDFKDGKAEDEVAIVSSIGDLESVRVEPDEETSVTILDEHVDGVDEASDVSNFQVLDTCSANDIHVALKEGSDGKVGKSQEPFDSKDEQTEAKDKDVGSTVDLDSTNMISLDKPLDGLDETPENSTFQVTDARPMKDIHGALKEVSDSTMGKSPEPLDSKDGSAQVQVDKVSSIEDVEEASMAALDKPRDGLDEASESSKFETRR